MASGLATIRPQPLWFQRLLPNVRISVVGDGGVPASSEAFHRMQDVKFGSVGEGGQRAWPIDVSADSATQRYEAGLVARSNQVS